MPPSLMNPLVGLQDPRAAMQPTMSWQQGMPGLMGNVYQPQNSQASQPQFSQPPSLMNYQPGQWSQMAYQMAGSPRQGPYPSVPVPAMPPGVNAGSSGGGGGALGGTALGILGALAKNPGLLKSAGNGVSSLWNSLTGAGSAAGAGAASGATAFGTDAGVTAGVSPLISELPATATGTYGSGLAGLMAGGDASLAPVGTDAISAVGDSAGAVPLGTNASGVLGTGMSGTQMLGAAAVPLSLYNEISNWQSGATGQDALGGAESGAALGTAIMPGIGTAIGAVGGALAGALSSAFGPGKVDPENANFEQYTQAFNKAPAEQQAQVAAGVQNPYLPLAGYFDLRSGQMKGSNPIYDSYGRKGEQKFTNDLIGKVQQGQQSGIKDSTQMWNQVVQPWINSMGTWQDSNKNAMTGLIQNMVGQVMGGTYQQNFKAIGGDSPFAKLPASGSSASTAAPTPLLQRQFPRVGLMGNQRA